MFQYSICMCLIISLDICDMNLEFVKFVRYFFFFFCSLSSYRFTLYVFFKYIYSPNFWTDYYQILYSNSVCGGEGLFIKTLPKAMWFAW